MALIRVEGVPTTFPMGDDRLAVVSPSVLVSLFSFKPKQCMSMIKFTMLSLKSLRTPLGSFQSQ